jgi:hypothetical protein
VSSIEGHGLRVGGPQPGPDRQPHGQHPVARRRRIHEYTSLLEDTRRHALDRLVSNATLVGANAVISMRFDSSEIAGSMSEIVAYGTAVIVEPDASAATAASSRVGVNLIRESSSPPAR